MRIVIIILFFGVLIGARAQEIPAFSGGYMGALGHQAALAGMWSTQANPAGLADVSKQHVAFGGEMPFALKELMRSSILYTQRFFNAGLAFQLQQQGTDGFQVTGFDVAVGKRLNESLQIGTQLAYQHLQVGENQQRFHGLQFHLGVAYQIERIHFGAFVRNGNPNPFSTGTFSATTPKSGLGLRWELSDAFTCFATSLFAPNFSIDQNIGFIHQFSEALQVMGSVSTATRTVRFGVELQTGHYNLLLTHQWHQSLGYTPSIAISYAW
ncbi:MAG: hypothetical protein LAT76_03685 [Schleiferiaceae bacterium]|nr:hypothetical protein [Schleiferiaceae bacterium]